MNSTAYVLQEDAYVTVGQVRTRYWSAGNHGSSVVLIHGLGGFVENWLLVFNALAAGYRVYALDLPGHGRTDKPIDGPYQIAQLAGFVRQFMLELGIERACLVGHSLGGAVAARMALMCPNLVDKLVLVSSAGLGPDLGWVLRLASVPVVGEILTRPSRSAIAQVARSMGGLPADLVDQAIELWLEMSSLPGAQRALLSVLRANASLLGQRPEQVAPIVAGLGSIACPVLVLWGRQDVVVPVTHAQVAGSGLPNVRMRILDQCGHIPMFEQPEAVIGALLEFLKNESAG
jgi:4,5:9,10-diseco-3-hydroxy-5,9,17-trioxoandrosta-1(10),2-diene-4-oate hydrolase